MSTAADLVNQHCDAGFGPFAKHCADHRFDFTLGFEQSILTLGPCSLFLACMVPRIFYLSRQSPKLSSNIAHYWKSVSISCRQLEILDLPALPSHLLSKLTCYKAAYSILIASQLSLLILWCKGFAPTNSITLAAASISLLSALGLGVLSYLEHHRTTRPSTIILVYLIFSSVFDAAQCRTMWMSNNKLLGGLLTLTIGSKVVAFVLELMEKRKLLLPPWNKLNREVTSSIINHSFFWWLNELLLSGFSATLSTDTLYDIETSMKSENLSSKMKAKQQAWSGVRLSPLRRYRPLLALCDALRGALLKGIFPRLCLTAFKFAQPFLIKRVIHFISEKRSVDAGSPSLGIALAGATGIAYFGYAISQGFYQHFLFRFLVMVRGILVSSVYTSTLGSQSVAATGVSSVKSNSAALTLVGPDIASITRALENIHELWANPVEIVLAVWLLARELGAGSAGPAIAVIICTVAMTKLSRHMGPAMKNWNAAIQVRTSITSKVLEQMKEVKMLRYSESWSAKIQAKRVDELQQSKKFRTFIAYMNVLGNTPSALSPILTFGIAIGVQSTRPDGETLSISTAFTALSIISLIVGPLARLLSSVPSFLTCIGSFERIDAFSANARLDSQSDNEADSSLPGTLDPANGIELGRAASTIEFVFRLNNVTFEVPGAASPVLQNISLDFLPSTLSAVIGKVGSGKSMLLLGLLRELNASAPFVCPVSGVAYCSQKPWLVSGTVKQNIMGLEANNPDMEWYNTVVQACALDRDLQMLVDGDETAIGNQGQTLSGGQQQRVALARALFSREPVLVADDILSGLDPQTKEQVWNRVFSPSGLLRRLKVTTILATHTLDYIRDCDNIVLLEQGKIKLQGTYDALHDQLLPLLRQQTDSLAGSSTTSSAQLIMGQGKKKKVPKDENIQEAEDIAQSGDFALYTFYFKSIGWRLSLLAISLGAATVFLAQFSQIWLKWWTEADEQRRHPDLGKYYGTYIALLCLHVIFVGIDCWVMFVVIIPRSAEWLHWKLLRATMGATMSFFHETDNGDLVNRFTQDMSLVDRELPTAVYTTLSGVLGCIGEICLILTGAKYLAAALPIAMIFLYTLQKFYLRTSRQLRILDLHAKAPLYTHLLEIIDGLATIRAFRWQHVTTQETFRLLDRSQRPHYLLLSVQRWLNLVLDLFVTVSAFFLVLFGVLSPSSTPGSMAVAMYSVLGFSETLAGVISSWTELETSLGAITRVKEYIRSTPQEEQPLGDRSSLKPTAPWPSQGRVQFSNVHASYLVQGESVPALNSIFLNINPGEKVAICGRTGSGKSTLLSTLFKTIDYSGTIVVDGVDIASLPSETVRSGLIVVPQQPVLFPGSLRSNLVPGCTGSEQDGKITALLRKLCVWEAVSRQGNLDTAAEELTLSVGEKQLLCLARAILRKEESRILLLDEAMSAVDGETEKIMVAALDEEFKQHTVISVVHRLDTVKTYDTLVLIDGGKTVQVGTPKELIDSKAIPS